MPGPECSEEQQDNRQGDGDDCEAELGIGCVDNDD